MNIKIDKKEKFTVIAPQQSTLNFTTLEELKNLLLGYLQKNIPHIILNLEQVQIIDEAVSQFLFDIQQNFYQHSYSLVICHLQPQVKNLLNEKKMLNLMNITPTESEAWDIVQMEEIERELLDGSD